MPNRNITTEMWNDPKIVDEFEALDIYLFQYLLTSPHTYLCGIMKCSLRTISLECKLELDEIRNRIDEKLLNFDEEIKMLAQVVYNEARGVKGTHHKAAVMWCVLNRVDSETEFHNSIKEVVTHPNAFAWYSSTRVQKEFVELAKDVVTRWLLEKEGIEEVGRVLPVDYYFFHGANGYNHFRKTYTSKEYWDWSLESPYPD